MLLPHRASSDNPGECLVPAAQVVWIVTETDVLLGIPGLAAGTGSTGEVTPDPSPERLLSRCWQGIKGKRTGKR